MKLLFRCTMSIHSFSDTQCGVYIYLLVIQECIIIIQMVIFIYFVLNNTNFCVHGSRPTTPISTNLPSLHPLSFHEMIFILVCRRVHVIDHARRVIDVSM